MDGRFDLQPPEGTCYLAEAAGPAMRERLGPIICRAGHIHRGELAEGEVSRLSLPDPVQTADATCADAASYGCTTEVSTVLEYDLTQRWAAALRAAGYGGIRYEARSTPSARSYAIFGDEGSRDDWAVDAAPRPGVDLGADELKLTVYDSPRPGELRNVVPPPP